VPRSLFPELIGQVDQLSERLCKAMNQVNSVQNEFVEKVVLRTGGGQIRGLADSVGCAAST
jgi:hypothetical protein